MGQEDGQTASLGGVALDEGGQAGNVVAVFVGDEDGVKARRVFAGSGEALKGLLAAESGVDQDA